MACSVFDKLLRACSGLDSSMALDGFRLPWFGDVGYACLACRTTNTQHNAINIPNIILASSFLYAFSLPLFSVRFVMAKTKKDL